MFKRFKIWHRKFRLFCFRLIRQIIVFFCRLWIKKIDGYEKIPRKEPAIIVSNHVSYFDFLLLASILPRNAVFVAVKDLDKRKFVGWFTKLDMVIFIDREKPGYRFFKEIIRNLKEQKRLIVIYPEGTRSRSGNMLPPKPGFVKLAYKTGVPIIPVAMSGTYEILPPSRMVPNLRRCDIYIGTRINVGALINRIKQNVRSDNIAGKISPHIFHQVAVYIMDKIRKKTGQKWENSITVEKCEPPEQFLFKDINNESGIF